MDTNKETQFLKNQRKKEKELYREIFVQTQNEFFAQADKMRAEFKCKDGCSKCYELIYVNKTPNKIMEKVITNDPKKNFWLDFKKFFTPCG